MHTDKQWYCEKCHKQYKINPHNKLNQGKPCQGIISEFSYDKYRKKYLQIYNIVLSDDEIENIYVNDVQHSNIDGYIDRRCLSTKYIYTASEGWSLQEYSKEYLDIWKELMTIP